MGNPELVQVPWLEVTETKVTPAGKTSVMVTPPTVMGWRLAIVMV
jgi:hypothetical protein